MERKGETQTMVQSLLHILMFNILLFINAPIANAANTTVTKSSKAGASVSSQNTATPRSAAGPGTLFEGYYKVSSSDQHIGYSILRYQFDPKKKQFLSHSLMKINSGGTEVLESLIAIADETLIPISYKYTSLVGTHSKTIDAQFTKGKMTAKVSETGKKAVSIKNDLKPGTFLSTFLVYTMLRSPSGIQTSSNYDYFAIAEEDGLVETGKAQVLKEEKFKGFSAFRIENTFKKTKFISYVNDKGEALAIEIKGARILTELVAKPADAIGTIGLPESVAKSIFGSIPVGDQNVVSRYFKQIDQIPVGGKQHGVPPGQGIIIKGQTTPTSPKANENSQEGP